MVFTSTRSGDRDIYIRDMATGAVTQLTDTAAHEFDPALSPDGTRIAFWRAGSLANRTYVMDADGSDEHIVAQPLSGDIVNDEHPSWSPDSTRLVLSSRFVTQLDSTYSLTIVDPDDPTGGRTNGGAGSTTAGLSGGVDEIEPVWSPDGEHIAFRQVPPGTSGAVGQLHVVDLETHTDRFLGRPRRIGDEAASRARKRSVCVSRSTTCSSPTAPDVPGGTWRKAMCSAVRRPGGLELVDAALRPGVVLPAPPFVRRRSGRRVDDRQVVGAVDRPST